jgi:hypothetical protein
MYSIYAIHVIAELLDVFIESYPELLEQLLIVLQRENVRT